MNFVPFSKKQLDVLSWWSPSRPSAKFDAIIIQTEEDVENAENDGLI